MEHRKPICGWPDIFKHRRRFSEDNEPYVETKRHLQAYAQDDVQLFLIDSEEMLQSHGLEEMKTFCSGFSAADLKAGCNEETHRRASWLDDRSSSMSRRTCDSTLTAMELYSNLLKPVSSHKDISS